MYTVGVDMQSMQHVGRTVLTSESIESAAGIVFGCLASR